MVKKIKGSLLQERGEPYKTRSKHSTKENITKEGLKVKFPKTVSSIELGKRTREKRR